MPLGTWSTYFDELNQEEKERYNHKLQIHKSIYAKPTEDALKIDMDIDINKNKSNGFIKLDL